jgi:hypothetical protein
MNLEIAMGRCYQLISFKNDCLNNLTQDQVLVNFREQIRHAKATIQLRCLHHC